MVSFGPADVVLLEGILVLYDPEIRDLMHMKLFVDTDSDTRLARRGAVIYSFSNDYYILIIIVLRDTQEMGRDLDQVLNQYVNFVKPAFEEFTLPVFIKETSMRTIILPLYYDCRQKSMQI